MKRITRRDFLKTVKDVSIGLGILPLVQKIPSLPMANEEEVVNEAAEELLYSYPDSVTSMSLAEIVPVLEGRSLEIKRVL